MPKFEITSPSGERFEITAPEGSSEQQVMQYAQQQFSSKKQPEPKKPIMQKLGEDLQARNTELDKLAQMQKSGQITFPEEGIRAIGQGAGALLDIASAGASAVDYGLGGIPSAAIKGAGSMAGKLPIPGDDRNIGQYTTDTANYLAKGYNKLEKNYPRTMGMVGAAGNIASVMLPTPTKKVGQTLSESGVKKSTKWIDDLVLPPDTDAVIKERAKKGLLSEGIFAKKQIKPTKSEFEAAEIIKNIKGVSKINPPSKNYKVIKSEAQTRANKISEDLAKYNNYKLKTDTIDQGIYSTIRRNLEENPFLVKSNAVDLKETQENFISVLQKNIASEPQTLQGLLNARRKFDQFVETQRPSALQPEALGAYSQTVKTVRGAVNDFIDGAVPDEAVKKRLRESHVLYDAADNILDKIPASANGVFEKIAQKIPGTGVLGKAGASALGAGAVAGGATFAPAATAIAATAGGLYLGGKLLNSGASRKLIGGLLKSPALSKADAAALQDYMEYLQNQEDETLKQPAKDVINNSKGNQ